VTAGASRVQESGELTDAERSDLIAVRCPRQRLL